jgi:hypothetical protein
LAEGKREEKAKDPSKTPKLLTPYSASQRLEEEASNVCLSFGDKIDMNRCTYD